MPKAKYVAQKDGRYQARVWDGTYTDNGKKHYVTLYSSKSSKNLENKVNQYKDDLRNGTAAIQSNIAFIDYSRKWLETYKAVREKNTVAMYHNIIEKHFIVLSTLELQDIKKTHFQEVINSAVDKPRTCQQIAVTFKQVIRAAVDDRLISPTAAVGICKNIEIPRYVPSEKRALTAAEKAAIKTAEFTDKEKAFAYILLGCGLRRGEALALTVFDIDIANAELTVNKSLAFDNNSSDTKDTKTANGRRTVPMPPFLCAYLEKYTKTLKNSYLFTMRGGGYMTKSSYVKFWAAIVKKINAAAGGSESAQVVYRLTAHVFRHNYCTELCYKLPEITLDEIALYLGDTKKMVTEVYSHIIKEKQDTKSVIKAVAFF